MIGDKRFACVMVLVFWHLKYMAPVGIGVNDEDDDAYNNFQK